MKATSKTILIYLATFILLVNQVLAGSFSVNDHVDVDAPTSLVQAYSLDNNLHDAVPVYDSVSEHCDVHCHVQLCAQAPLLKGFDSTIAQQSAPSFLMFTYQIPVIGPPTPPPMA